MSIPEGFRAWCIEILSSDFFKQIAPLIVVFVVPTLVYSLVIKVETLRDIHKLAMVLQNFGFSLPWHWGSGVSSLSTLSERKDKKSKKPPRTRAEQIAMNGFANHDQEDEIDNGCYPGLVNISGTYCFMNSTLQAMASLSYLQPYIEAIHTKAEVLDLPTPVIDALKDLLYKLNKPRTSYHAIRPHEIIEALSNQPDDRRSSLFNSREHQDAQELFQLLSECIKNEAAAVDKEGFRDRGLGGFSHASLTSKEIGKSVFDGLTANRRSCVVCGYTEAVMHFTLDNWQLSVPRLAASCRLEDCLEDYTTLELLHDCICRKCSLLATQKRLQSEVIALEEAVSSSTKVSGSKKKRLKEVRKMERSVRSALEEGRIEDYLPDVKMDKVFSKVSTKQAMIARPPRVLALHINRSIHYGHYATRNNVRVIFPEVLDLTPYTTSGSLSTIPTSAISAPSTAIHTNRSTTPTPSSYANQRTLYRLSAVVCHFGQHSFGHYICYRRKPRSPKLPADKRYAPPRLIDPLHLEGDSRMDGSSGSLMQYLWEDEEDDGRPQQRQAGRGWLRISDDSVQECGIETVLQEGVGAFMLYYERAVQVTSGIYPSAALNTSEETLKPEMRKFDLNGSVGSLVSEIGVGVLHHSSQREKVSLNGSATSPMNVSAPRVVRSVAMRKNMSNGGDSGMTRSLNGLPVQARIQENGSALPNGIMEHQRHTHSNGSANRLSLSESVPSLLSARRSLSPTRGSIARALGVSVVSPSSSSPLQPSSRHTHVLKHALGQGGPSPVVGLKA